MLACPYLGNDPFIDHFILSRLICLELEDLIKNFGGGYHRKNGQWVVRSLTVNCTMMFMNLLPENHRLGRPKSTLLYKKYSMILAFAKLKNSKLCG